MILGIPKHRRMIRNVDARASQDLRARRRALSQRHDGCGMGSARAADPGGQARRSSVYNIFRNFQKDGVWDAIWDKLHMALREDREREASPTAAIIDSQSLKSAEKGAVMTA